MANPPKITKTSRRGAPRRTAGAALRRQKRQVKASLWLILFCAAVFAIANYMMARDRERRAHSQEFNVDGDLTEVITNPSLDETIVQYTGMTVSFNPTEHVPNWVAYELTAEEATGTEPRYNNFREDTDVAGCATPADYRNTGFDRGHMAPAADMKWNQEAMRESFLMTNIVPQVHVVNRGAWSSLEDKCRARAVADSAVYIVCGPVLTDPIDFRIGQTGVAVPRRFFKVILSPYADPPTAIGFLMPNESFSGGMQVCAVTVDSVEAVTGHDFFSALPDDIESQLESTINFHQWSRIRK